MKRKVDTLANKYTKLLESLPGVDAVILGESVENEIYDPYIIVEFDVFYDGDILTSTDRKILFENPDAFETSPVYPVDKFLMNELPVIINYRNMKSINALFDRIEDNNWSFRRDATSLLYRIRYGHIRLSKSHWLDSIRKRINNINGSFWKNIINSTRFLAENALMEMGISLIKNNNLHYQYSLAGFMQNVCTCVFALNREFLPSPRLLSGEITKLKVLPNEFLSFFEGISSLETDYTPERKVEIAKLIVKSLVPMGVE